MSGEGDLRDRLLDTLERSIGTGQGPPPGKEKRDLDRAVAKIAALGEPRTVEVACCRCPTQGPSAADGYLGGPCLCQVFSRDDPRAIGGNSPVKLCY